MKEVNETIIDYEAILSESPDTDNESIIQFLCEALPYEWCEKYQEMTPSETNILQFNDNGFDFLFDFSSGLIVKVLFLATKQLMTVLLPFSEGQYRFL